MRQFKLLKKLDNGVRDGELETPHGIIQTPFFMPVATVGSVKSVAPWELEQLGAEIILCNTYHLYLRPGEQLIKGLGGLHNFMRWNKPILTDSGGYQVFSLAKNNSLVKISEDGVEFKSHLDGSKHFFTPEKVIQIQFDLGVDVLMPLDICPGGKATSTEVKRATELTIKWAERAKRYFESRFSNLDSRMKKEDRKKNKDILTSKIYNLKSAKAVRPLLHGIVQGGLDLDLRKKCAEKLIDMDFDGYSVGGLAVDLETRDMWRTVELMGEILPENKQRYLMGVGTPDDIIKATQLGMDMFDCVLPTRMARHGSVYNRCHTDNLRSDGDGILTSQACTPQDDSNREPSMSNEAVKQCNNYELINLFNSQYRTDPNPIDKNCVCSACKGGFSRAYVSHLLRSNEILGVRLVTLHNLWQYLELMRELRGL